MTDFLQNNYLPPAIPMLRVTRLVVALSSCELSDVFDLGESSESDVAGEVLGEEILRGEEVRNNSIRLPLNSGLGRRFCCEDCLFNFGIA